MMVTLSSAQETVSFARDIEPILENSCWKCHGEAMQLSKLDLRTLEGALKGGEKGASIVPGKAEDSRLYRRVAGLERPAMPMDGKLTGDQISTIRAWIDQGYVVRSFNQDKPYNIFIKEQVAGDELETKSADTMIATGFLRAGPRVHFREKDTPERRFDYLDDVMATIGRGILGLTVQCARCHNHKFDPIPQKDYYSLQAAIFGYVETTYPLVPKEEADAYNKEVEGIDAQIKPLRERIAEIEAPYREKLKAEALRKYPENVQRAVEKPENERTPGEKLLATQVIEGGLNVNGPTVERALTPEHAAERKALNDRIAALQKEKPQPIPVADIVTDGDYRFTPLGPGEYVIGCVKRRIQEAEGTFLHTGPARYQVPPSYFLVRGDPASKGSLMKPGFITVATYGNPATYRFNGRDMRLTDVYGELIPQIAG